MGGNALVLERHAVEPFLKNGYLLGCTETRQATYIDPGDEAEVLLQRLEVLDYELVSILNTHAHLDHISGIGRVRRRWQVPIFLHRDDLILYDSLEEQAKWFGLEADSAPPVDRFLKHGQDVRVGELELRVFHTPGHSPGSVTFVTGDHVFCGDVIFAGSIGRTDLPGGSMETLIRSIRETVLSLGDEKTLHPGHGPDTTVGRERETNPFLTGSPLL